MNDLIEDFVVHSFIVVLLQMSVIPTLVRFYTFLGFPKFILLVN